MLYPLPEILLLVLCATLAGMEHFVEITLWGRERLEFLRRFLAYERGAPSHDTLGDVIGALDPERRHGNPGRDRQHHRRWRRRLSALAQGQPARPAG